MDKINRLKTGFLCAISRYVRFPSDLITLHNVGVETQHVKRKFSEIFESVKKMNIGLDNTAIAEYEFPQDFSLMDQDCQDDLVMVGFEKNT